MHRTFMSSASTFRLAGLALLLSTMVGADWPAYRHDAARSGYTPEPLGKQLELRWVHQPTAAPRPAWPANDRIQFDLAFQPIVVGELVLLGSSADDQVRALDRATGKVRWTFFTEGPVRFAPVAWHDRVFVASDDGFLYALALDDGRLLWRHRGGPADRRLLGNERMISRWPARGGPVVVDNTVYYAAGIWPTEGIFLHALNAEDGHVLWTNDRTGSLRMGQPHGGSDANSGVTAQGYLAASAKHLFVPTGRAVPAAFDRRSGELAYYHLQANHSIGGTRMLLADRFFANGGCLFEQDGGKIAARGGRGVLSAIPDGMLQATENDLLVYRWAEQEAIDRKGKKVAYRGLSQIATIHLADMAPPPGLEKCLQRFPALKDLYRPDLRFQAAYDSVLKQSNLEVTLQQLRPEMREYQLEPEQFLTATCERRGEVIAAAHEAVVGHVGQVRVVDLAAGTVRWSHAIDGAAVGLAAANGELFVATTTGNLYCFGTAPVQSASMAETSAEPVAPQAVAAARAILSATGVTEGWCIDLSAGTGDLARALAEHSKLHICAVEADPAKVAIARRKLATAGLYGTRVTVHLVDPQKPPYARYWADLIVSSRGLVDGWRPAPDIVERLQRPEGGVACLGTVDKLDVGRRGSLPGAGSWTHLNANPANTLCSNDALVQGPLETAWFRDVEFEMPDRHAQGPAPLSHRGCLVSEGVDGLCALDSYNGRTLWTYPIEGILRDQDGSHHDVGVGDTGSNFCLGDDSVYVAVGRRCLRLDLRTGRKLAEYSTPVPDAATDNAWGYVAYHQGTLFGSVLNASHVVSPRYRGIRLRTESTLLFAIDVRTGKLKWQYRPHDSIRNNTIAIAADRLYCIDRPLVAADRIEEPKYGGKHRLTIKPGEQPSGKLLALDVEQGKVAWQSTDDIFGTQLAVSEEHGVLLMYYQAVRFDFFKLPSEVGGRLAALDSATGQKRWDRAANHKTRPIILGDTIYAYGGAWKLKTGEEVPFALQRTHGCGQIAAGRQMLLFRSATLAYVDLAQGPETVNFGGIRPGCWINAIPAAGLALVPDGSAKCACSYQMHAWLALASRE